MAEVIAICISEKKGTAKEMINTINLIENFGLEGDAHGGNWHRQVSLLALEKIEEFNKAGGSVKYGDFGENLVISEVELDKLKIGQLFNIGDTLLEVTQIGKACHSKCDIFYRVGRCIMPKFGVFARVLNGGKIRVGDTFTLKN